MTHRFRGIAFLGNYLPRACGIATFTHDLATAVSRQVSDDQPVVVAAMNDLPEGYSYPDIVKFELRQDYQIDYSRAADFLNFSHIDIVSLQHEYGIYGGEYGSNVLTFLRDLNRPAPDGRKGSLRINQDALIYSSILDTGHHLVHELRPGRSAWLHIVYGEATLKDIVLTRGDGVGVTVEPSVSLTVQENAEILLVDLCPAPDYSEAKVS